MRCPICRGDTRVIESRLDDDGYSRRRWRKCRACLHQFLTRERVK